MTSWNLLEQYLGPVAIVPNNAGEAIEAWLTATDLRQFVEVIAGRDPRHMKPDPRSLVASADAIGCQLDQCVFVSDSLTNARAADRAGTTIIALANRPQKRQLFATEGCTTIVETIHELIPSGSVISRTE